MTYLVIEDLNVIQNIFTLILLLFFLYEREGLILIEQIYAKSKLQKHEIK